MHGVEPDGTGEELFGLPEETFNPEGGKESAEVVVVLILCEITEERRTEESNAEL